MNTRKLLALAGTNVRRSRRRVVLAAAGVALGAGCLAFFLALGAGLEAAVHDVFPVSTRELEVVPPPLSLGSLLGETKLDNGVIRKLEKLPEVENVTPKMAARFPSVTRYNGMFFGREIHMGLEVIANGLPPELVTADAKLPFVDPGPGKPIPVLVNRRLLEIYNKVFAPQRGLPQLSESMLIGFQIPIELGRSWVASRNMPNLFEGSLQIVGFSDRALIAGVSMPLPAVRRLNQHFALDSRSYSSLIVRARQSDDVGPLHEAIRRMGYELDEGERNRALEIGAAVRIFTLALSLLAALITALAAINIAQSYSASVRERRREIGVLRALGATRRDVSLLLLAEAGATGLLGGAAGSTLALVSAMLLDRMAHTRLPEFPFKPQHFFHFTPWMWAVGLLVALAAALFGAYWPARVAGGLDPAQALSEA